MFSQSAMGFWQGAYQGAVIGSITGAVGVVVNAGFNSSLDNLTLNAVLGGAAIGALTGAIMGGIKAGIRAKKAGLNFWKGDGTISMEVATPPVGSDYEQYQSDAQMRADYDARIGRQDGIKIDEVESKLNTHVSNASTTNLPEGFNIDSDGYMYRVNSDLTRSYAGGVASVKNPVFGSRSSLIRISPAMKSLPTVQLNNVFKHEFMHAWHWSSGLNYKYSELATSSYSTKYARNYGFNASPYLSELQGEISRLGLTHYPTNMSYQAFNKVIPSWLK